MPTKLPISEPGVYPDVLNEDYHYNPLLTPTVAASSSMLKTILDSNPKTAWMGSAALNPMFERTFKSTFDLGSAAHAVILGERNLIKVINADDYRTNAGKEARDQARAAGQVPVLRDEIGDVEMMALAARAQLDRHEEDSGAFKNGTPEVTLIWNEGDEALPIWCKARLDWLFFKREDGTYPNVTYDLKSTGASAGPEWGTRTGPDMGADIQAAWYCRAMRKVLGIEYPHFRFVVVENYAPYCLMTHELTPEAMDAAEAKVEYALAYFKWCVRKNSWPGYPGRTNWIQIAPWKLAEAEYLKRLRADPKEQEELFRMAITFNAPL